MMGIRRGSPGEGESQKEKKQKRPKKARQMKCLKGRKTSATEMTQRRPPNPASNADYIVSRYERILVSGSSGFVGTKVVATLLDYGFTDISCLVQPSSELNRPAIPPRHLH